MTQIVVLVLVSLNFLLLASASWLLWRARQEIREVRNFESRAVRAMHDAAVLRGEVFTMHPEVSHSVRSSENGSRPPLRLVG